jgi:pimeloyl-ACP methyl ester carboxylesterase
MPTIRQIATLLLLAFALPVAAAEYGGRLEGFDYPHPVNTFAFDSQGQTLEMAYMDVEPETPNGETVLLLHGKNYCAATWEATITALADAGFRVVAMDQIGFCKSSKPEHYQFTLYQLAANTRALLGSLGIEKTHVLGHSMGGMLAARYALMYPDATAQLLMLMAQRGRLVCARESHHGRIDPRLPARGVFQRRLETRVRPLGRDARWHVRRPGGRARGVESGSDLGHGVHPAGGVRVPRHPCLHHAVHRPARPNRHRA